MSAETLFLICNNGVLPAWLLLAVAPGWIWTQRLVHSAFIPILLGLVYGWAFLSSTGAPGASEGANFFTLPGVMQFFSVESAALAGWVHYLVFDLFVGAWEVRDSRRLGIHQLAVVPCLVFTLMLGPLGLLAYLGLRLAWVRRFSLEEGPGIATA